MVFPASIVHAATTVKKDGENVIRFNCFFAMFFKHHVQLEDRILTDLASFVLLIQYPHLNIIAFTRGQ